MNFSDLIVFILEMIGTIAFASSGALIGIKKGMDIFGINVLGITTAIGGGILRDVVLGIHPPKTFLNPIYVLVAIGTSTVLFMVIYFHRKFMESKWMAFYEKMMLLLDALGLGTFTVLGINTALGALSEEKQSVFLLLFVGVMTGIGGGMLRDVMAGLLPYVFVKHFYACASLIGAGICVLMIHLGVMRSIAMIVGAIVVVVLRLLAAHYKWNLPRIIPDGKWLSDLAVEFDKK